MLMKCGMMVITISECSIKICHIYHQSSEDVSYSCDVSSVRVGNIVIYHQEVKSNFLILHKSIHKLHHHIIGDICGENWNEPSKHDRNHTVDTIPWDIYDIGKISKLIMHISKFQKPIIYSKSPTRRFHHIKYKTTCQDLILTHKIKSVFAIKEPYGF